MNGYLGGQFVRSYFSLSLKKKVFFPYWKLIKNRGRFDRE